MKFYITEETKQEIEFKIEELKTTLNPKSLKDSYKDMGKISIYKEILKNSIILIEDNWYNVLDNISGNPQCRKTTYENGVIIQPKQ
jgi:hypothetical protein